MSHRAATAPSGPWRATSTRAARRPGRSTSCPSGLRARAAMLPAPEARLCQFMKILCLSGSILVVCAVVCVGRGGLPHRNPRLARTPPPPPTPSQGSNNLALAVRHVHPPTAAVALGFPYAEHGRNEHCNSLATVFSHRARATPQHRPTRTRHVVPLGNVGAVATRGMRSSHVSTQAAGGHHRYSGPLPPPISSPINNADVSNATGAVEE